MTEATCQAVAWRWISAYMNEADRKEPRAWHVSPTPPSGHEGYVVDRLYPQAVVDALRGEIEALKASAQK